MVLHRLHLFRIFSAMSSRSFYTLSHAPFNYDIVVAKSTTTHQLLALPANCTFNSPMDSSTTNSAPDVNKLIPLFSYPKVSSTALVTLFEPSRHLALHEVCKLQRQRLTSFCFRSSTLIFCATVRPSHCSALQKLTTTILLERRNQPLSHLQSD